MLYNRAKFHKNIFSIVAEIGLQVIGLYTPRIRRLLPNYSTLSFFGVYGSKSTKFSTLIKHLRYRPTVYLYKFDGGL